MRFDSLRPSPAPTWIALTRRCRGLCPCLQILVRDNKIRCYVMGGAGTYAEWALDSDARWYHVACVHDESADVFTLYIDGVAVATGTQPASVGNPTTTNLLIGNWAGSGNRLFKGKVGDVQVFDRPLSEAEVAALASP